MDDRRSIGSYPDELLTEIGRIAIHSQVFEYAFNVLNRVYEENKSVASRSEGKYIGSITRLLKNPPRNEVQRLRSLDHTHTDEAFFARIEELIERRNDVLHRIFHKDIHGEPIPSAQECFELSKELLETSHEIVTKVEDWWFKLPAASRDAGLERLRDEFASEPRSSPDAPLT